MACLLGFIDLRELLLAEDNVVNQKLTVRLLYTQRVILHLFCIVDGPGPESMHS